MKEVWMLDYLNAVFPAWGVFESEEAAMTFVETHDPERRNNYKPFKITVNRDLEDSVPHTAPFNYYLRQR